MYLRKALNYYGKYEIKHLAISGSCTTSAQDCVQTMATVPLHIETLYNGPFHKHLFNIGAHQGKEATIQMALPNCELILTSS